MLEIITNTVQQTVNSCWAGKRLTLWYLIIIDLDTWIQTNHQPERRLLYGMISLHTVTLISSGVAVRSLSFKDPCRHCMGEQSGHRPPVRVQWDNVQLLSKKVVVQSFLYTYHLYIYIRLHLVHSIRLKLFLSNALNPPISCCRDLQTCRVGWRSITDDRIKRLGGL